LGCERKVREGYSLCGHSISYGYDREKGQKIQAINEEQAEVVRQIFDWYVKQNISFSGIAKRLNIMKIPTKHNTVWGVKTIQLVLTNCNYIGKVRYQIENREKNFEVDGLHEPIIDRDVFDQAQILFAKNKGVAKTKKPRNENYFLGFLYCPRCGSKMQTKSEYRKMPDGTIKYVGAYACRYKYVHACELPSMRHHKVESAFMEYAGKIADLKETDGIQMEEEESNSKKLEELIKAYHEKLAQLDLREKEVLDLYVDGDIVFERYRTIKDRLDKNKKEINSELEMLSVENIRSKITEKDFTLAFKDNWEHLTDIEKRQFLMKFIKKIHVSSHKEGDRHNWVVSVKGLELS